MKLKKHFLYVCLAACLFYRCNVDYAFSTISTSIVESKKRGFFLFEYKMDSLVILDKKKLFVVKKAWLEKSHTSTMNIFGIESYQIDSRFNQVVFDIDNNSHFTERNLDNWMIEDEKGNLPNSENRMISVILKDKSAPQHIRFLVYSLKIPGVFNYDKIQVAEFILKKQ